MDVDYLGQVLDISIQETEKEFRPDLEMETCSGLSRPQE
jgi:hypothetical protein